jgi:two-component system phosphate regulon sensor histidine kinase PhoR
VHITNVLSNLIDNALKYSSNTPKIHIKTRNLNNGIIISVKDYGIGISKENTTKIFDKLFRVPTGTVHDVKGFGLGLSYVKAIVDKHKGSIKVSSQIGKGSTFSIHLPFKINENEQ